MSNNSNQQSRRLHANPKKLNDGTWGAFCDGRPAPGECITVTNKSGASRDAYVDRVIWQGDEGAIVSLEGQEQSGGGARRSRTDGGGKNEAPSDNQPPPNNWGEGYRA